MKYDVEYSKTAMGTIKKMDSSTSKIIRNQIEKNLINTKNPYIIEKLNSFSKLKKLLEESPYLYDFHPHSTPKVELDKIIANIDKEIKKELIGLKFLKNLSGKFYVPASIERRKASEITTEDRKRIIFILEKNLIDREYSKIIFKVDEEDISLYFKEIQKT